jgi:hypothetical protein
MYETFTLFGHLFHGVLLSICHHISLTLQPSFLRMSLGCSAFARRYWRNLYWFIFLTLLRCFSSDGILHVATLALRLSLRHSHYLAITGLLHSETAGSMDYNSSPTNIAVIYVLLRHEYPGHPLSTLLRYREQKIHSRLGAGMAIVHIIFDEIKHCKRIKTIIPYDATTYLSRFYIGIINILYIPGISPACI